MRVMVANAAPWSFALKQQYVADFPPESLFEIYGSTELGVNTVMRPEDQMRKPGSCGKEAPMVEIRLYDDDGEAALSELHRREIAPESALVRRSSLEDLFRRHEEGSDMAFGFTQLGMSAAHLGDTALAYECVEYMVNSYWSPAMVSLHNVRDVFNLDISGGLPAVVITINSACSDSAAASALGRPQSD